MVKIGETTHILDDLIIVGHKEYIEIKIKRNDVCPDFDSRSLNELEVHVLYAELQEWLNEVS